MEKYQKRNRMFQFITSVLCAKEEICIFSMLLKSCRFLIICKQIINLVCGCHIPRCSPKQGFCKTLTGRNLGNGQVSALTSISNLYLFKIFGLRNHNNSITVIYQCDIVVILQYKSKINYV